MVPVAPSRTAIRDDSKAFKAARHASCERRASDVIWFIYPFSDLFIGLVGAETEHMADRVREISSVQGIKMNVFHTLRDNRAA